MEVSSKPEKEVLPAQTYGQPKQAMHEIYEPVVYIAERSRGIGFRRLYKSALLSSSHGLWFIILCFLLALGGGTATVIEVARNINKSSSSALQKTVASPNLPAASEATPTTGSRTGSNPTSSSSPSNKSVAVVNAQAPNNKTAVAASSGTPSVSNSSGSGTSSSGGSGSSVGGSTNSYGGCTSNGNFAPCVGSTTNGQSGWGTPSFDDEFNGNTLNTSSWNTHNGWTNQNNVTTYASNVSVSGGYAILTLASSSSGAEIGTSTYTLPVNGFAEARIEFPGSGTSVYNWPAWWVSGPNWPQAGEADIFEGLGGATTNYHYYSGGYKQDGPFSIPGTWTNSFHVYGLYRGNGYNNVYWDGNLVKHYSTYDNGQGETLLLNVGAANTPAYGVSSEVKIDYVRAWN